MHLTDIYSKGEKYLREKEFGFLLDDVETGFIRTHDRKILDRYTFRQHCIDAVEPDTSCRVLGIDLATPVIMSAISAPIPAIAEDGLLQVAAGLKEAGSFMWVGSPSPRNLDELVATGVPIAANVKPLSDRRKMFSSLEEIQKAGAQWVGIEVDAGLGTKIRDRQVVSDCAPLSLEDLKEIRENVSVTLIFKGVLSGTDAIKSLEAGADGIVVSNHGAHTLDYHKVVKSALDSFFGF
jgi:isopentenyl diphosphate isomerase/L-lactate dehydrogenase-like FMN-dependent dehydrogenase